MIIETKEIFDLSYFGTPLYQGQKVLMLDGYLFADKAELHTYAREISKSFVLGGNLINS